MNTQEFKCMAMSHLRLVVVLFVCSLGISLIAYLIGVWASQLRGWQSDIVTGFFVILGGFAALNAIVFGALIWSWISEYKIALSESEEYPLEDMKWKRKSVLGPIPWGFKRRSGH